LRNVAQCHERKASLAIRASLQAHPRQVKRERQRANCEAHGLAVAATAGPAPDGTVYTSDGHPPYGELREPMQIAAVKNQIGARMKTQQRRDNAAEDAGDD
jgi:hypothetical protein